LTRSVEEPFLKRSFVIRVERVQSSSKFEEETTAVVVDAVVVDVIVVDVGKAGVTFIEN